jgi:uncharacterized protein
MLAGLKTDSMDPEAPHSPSPPPSLAPAPARQVGWRRTLWVGLGLLFVVLGAVGVVTPILPTTPFLLLASFFFVRSSPRLHAWLLRSSLFGPFLADWHRHRGVHRRTKVLAIGLTLAGAGASIALADLSLPVIVLLAALVATGVTVIARLPTIDRRPPEQ